METRKSPYEILRSHFPEGQYVILQEVSDAAGFSRSRSADFIVMSLWPSRGLDLIGIELKSYRGDWLGELKNPKKAENIFQYCDKWYLLTSDDSIAKEEEIPSTWGWISIKNEKIYYKKQAPKLSPLELSRHFLAAMLKRADSKSNFVHKDKIADKIKSEKETATKYIKESNERLSSELQECKKTISDFEKTSGIRIHDKWFDGISGKQAGEIISLLKNGGVDDLISRLENLQPVANKISETVGNHLESLRQINLTPSMKNDAK